MGLHLRKKIRLLPGLSITLASSEQAGPEVITNVKAGPIRWNSKTQKTSVNLPGPLSYRLKSDAKGLTRAQLRRVAQKAGLQDYHHFKKRELADLLNRHGLL